MNGLTLVNILWPIFLVVVNLAWFRICKRTDEEWIEITQDLNKYWLKLMEDYDECIRCLDSRINTIVHDVYEFGEEVEVQEVQSEIHN